MPRRKEGEADGSSEGASTASTELQTLTQNQSMLAFAQEFAAAFSQSRFLTFENSLLSLSAIIVTGIGCFPSVRVQLAACRSVTENCTVHILQVSPITWQFYER